MIKYIDKTFCFVEFCIVKRSSERQNLSFHPVIIAVSCCCTSSSSGGRSSATIIVHIGEFLISGDERRSRVDSGISNGVFTARTGEFHICGNCHGHRFFFGADNRIPQILRLQEFKGTRKCDTVNLYFHFVFHSSKMVMNIRELCP